MSHRLRKIAVMLLTGLAFLIVPPVAAQEGASQLSRAQTQKVVSAMLTVFSDCVELPEPYLPDCLGRGVQRGASKISKNPGYWEANVALTRAARALDRLVRSFEDESASRERAAGYRLRPVKPAALPQLRVAGQAILERAARDLKAGSAREIDAFAPITQALASAVPWP